MKFVREGCGGLCMGCVVFGWNDCLIVLEICMVGLWVGLWFFGVWGNWLYEKGVWDLIWFLVIVVVCVCWLIWFSVF